MLLAYIFVIVLSGVAMGVFFHGTQLFVAIIIYLAIALVVNDNNIW
jgi:hypothetical protein